MNAIDYKKFYAELGKLLYAMADVDKIISPAEKKAVYKIVRKELVPAEKHVDEFGTDIAFYAEIAFDYMDEEILGSESALHSFLDYIHGHQHLIDKHMRDTCIRIVDELAAAVHGKNEKERKLLHELKMKLKRIPA